MSRKFTADFSWYHWGCSLLLWSWPVSPVLFSHRSLWKKARAPCWLWPDQFKGKVKAMVSSC